MRFVRLLMAVACVPCLPAPANDTAVTLGAGGLIPVKTTAIVMESEELEVSLHRINVKYSFKNTSNRDVDVTVAFPLPEINGGDVANIPINIPSKDPLNYMAFEVWVAGKKVAPQVEVRSFFEDREITSELRALGMPLSALDGNAAAAMKKLSAADRARVLKNEWEECTLSQDGKCWPYWRSKIQFYWTQRFPAGAAIEVRPTYRPVVGGSMVYAGENPAERVNGYCGGPDMVQQIKRKQQGKSLTSGKPVYDGRTLDYILTTANNRAGPIRNFRLSVVSDGVDDLVMSCMGLKRLAPDRYGLEKSNFRPSGELKLLVLQPGKP